MRVGDNRPKLYSTISETSSSLLDKVDMTSDLSLNFGAPWCMPVRGTSIQSGSGHRVVLERLNAIAAL